MATVAAQGDLEVGVLDRPAPPAIRTMRPVVWWAVLGALFMGEIVYVFSRYLADLPKNIPAGPTHEPWWMAGNIHAQEVLFGVILVVIAVKFVVVPLVRRQPIPFDGLFILAFLTLMWQDSGIDWFRWWASFNSIVINRGSWYNHVAFWSAAPANGYAEAPVWAIGLYGTWALGSIWFCYIMRLAKRRWPQLGTVGIFGIILAFCVFFDLAVEDLWMRGGMYTYGGAPHGWFLLFSGKYYQFPLYEAPAFGLCMAVLAAVRYYKNDRGQTFAERRIEEVRVGRRAKTWVRFLALTGIVNLVYLVFNLMMTIPIIHGGGNWPADIQKRSYFVQQFCGAQTDRACPGPGVPLPLPSSAYVNQQGGLSHPPGWVRPILNVPSAKK